MTAATNYHRLSSVKITHAYSLTVLEVKNLKWVLLGQNLGFGRAVLFGVS